MSGAYGTYGQGLDANTAASGGETLLGLGAAQKRAGMALLGKSAEEEGIRNIRNKQAEQQEKAGNAQLGSALGGAAAGAAFGPWGALIGGAIGAIAGYNL